MARLMKRQNWQVEGFFTISMLLLLYLVHTSEWPCDAFLSKAPGEFASPQYPNNYPESARCSWRLTAPEGHRVRVHFTGLFVFPSFAKKNLLNKNS